MTYVDDMRAAYRGMKMCHMIADTSVELREMADKIGVRQKWLQSPGTHKEHFDICLTKRAKAIRCGAVEISTGELGVLLLQKRRTRVEINPQPETKLR